MLNNHETSAMVLPRALPRGRNALPREVVLVSQSQRLLQAVVEVVAENGYAATRVADIAARAGVSKGTFYQQFRDKEDAFLAAYLAGSRRLFEAIDQAGSDVDEPLALLRRGTRTYLQRLASQPAWSRALIIEVRAVPAAEGVRQQVHDWYVDLMRRWRQWAVPLSSGDPVPDCAYEACIDAINELVGRYVARANPEGLMSLEPAILYIQSALLGLTDATVSTAGGGPR